MHSTQISPKRSNSTTADTICSPDDTSLPLRGPSRQPLSEVLRLQSPLPGFRDWTVVGVEQIDEFGVTAYTIKHGPSGCTFIHIDSEDTHNYFSVSFRTPVWHSKGLPHVLEHTVLCGSSFYDVKDPFHAMTKRSLNTDMNATTSADHTTYHFSTSNAQDRSNLCQVYLDAVFFPRLREVDFRQEGHRIEPADPSTPTTSPLVIKGVVYNEMQGYMSSAGEHTSRALYSSLFPNSPYAHSHGGDPAVIPDLTHDEMVAFHSAHYRLGNALFCTYGDLSPLELIDHIDSYVLFWGRWRPSLGYAKERPFEPLPPLPMAVAPVPGPAVRLVRVPPSGNHAAPDDAGSVTGGDVGSAQAPSGSVPNSVHHHPVGSSLDGGEIDARVQVAASEAAAATQTDTPRQCTYIRGWAAGDSRDSYHTLVLRVVIDLLTFGTDSPLYRLLIQSGLASAFAPETGLACSSLQPVLVLGATGVQQHDADIIDNLILACLRYAADPTNHPLPVVADVHRGASDAGGTSHPKTDIGHGSGGGVVQHPIHRVDSDAHDPAVAEAAGNLARGPASPSAATVSVAPSAGSADGMAASSSTGGGGGDPFSPVKIRAMLHQMELALRTRTPAFGSQVGSAVTEQWAHGSSDPLAPLRVGRLFERLKVDLGLHTGTVDATPLRNALKTWTLDNAHCVRLLAVPDPTLPRQWEDTERARLAAAEATWTAAMRQAAATATIDAERRGRGDVSCLPGLTVADVSSASPVVESMTHSWLAQPPPPTPPAASIPAAGAPVSRILPVPFTHVRERCNSIVSLRLLFNLQLPTFAWKVPPGMTQATRDRAMRPTWQEAALQQQWPTLPDDLHVWLPTFCGFSAYGTRNRSPQQWETDSRLSLGGLSASISTASPSVLRSSHVADTLEALHRNQEPPLRWASPKSLEAALANDPSLVRTPPLYALAVEATWLADRTNDALAMLSEVLTDSSAHAGLLRTRDRGLLAQAIRSAAIDAAMNVNETGSSYAVTLAAASSNPLAWLREVQGGMTQTRFIQSLHQRGEEGVEAAACAMEAIAKSLLVRRSADVQSAATGPTMASSTPPQSTGASVPLDQPLRAMLTCDHGAGSDTIVEAVTSMLGRLPVLPLQPAKPKRGRPKKDAASSSSAAALITSSPIQLPPRPALGMRAIVNVPTSVNSLAVVMPGPAWGTPAHVHVHLLCDLLSSTKLHESIREQGGAYDVSARISTCDDIMITTSEDPSPLASLDRVVEAAAWAAETRMKGIGLFVTMLRKTADSVTASDLEEAKLRMFASIDVPVASTGKGLSAFLYGVTPEARQAYRDLIFAAEPEDVAAAAKRWLLEPMKKGRFSVAIAGPAPELLETAQADRLADDSEVDTADLKTGKVDVAEKITKNLKALAEWQVIDVLQQQEAPATVTSSPDNDSV